MSDARNPKDPWYLTSRTVCTGNRLQRAWIEIVDGRIRSVLNAAPTRGHVEDVGDFVILPGLVDTHVHVNEPGRTEWEGFDTATQAAAAGGATALVDMPLNCIPVTTTLPAFREKLSVIGEKLWIDVGFWGGAIGGQKQTAELAKLLDGGVLGVKTFLIDSGIPEFPPMTLEEVDQAMPELAKRGLPYLFHAELDSGEAKGEPGGPDYEAFLRSRPKAWENNAIEGVLALAKKHSCHVHIVHLSSAEALPLIHEARERMQVKVTVETCPHYLLLNPEAVKKFEPQEEQNLFKCCPPIREEANRQALWEGLLNGDIDMVVSDHSPCAPALKKFGSANFAEAWGGISSLQYTLPLLWTEGQRFALTLPRLADWLAGAPARMAGLGNKKGRIAPGFDADFCVFDSNADWVITPEGTLHRHKKSPYQGRRVQGRVVKTILRGETIFEHGKFPGQPHGSFLLKGRA